MLHLTNDQRKVEKALITFATISLSQDSPCIEQFYEAKQIDRLLKLANQLENRSSYYALDSLR